MDLANWYENLTYEEAKDCLNDEMRNIKNGFVAAGFYMKYIRDNELYKQAGYVSIWEFAEINYGISKSTASRWMAINDKFSKGGNSPFLEEQYECFEKSQLQEMLYLNDKQMEQIKPEMTAKAIREIRKEEKKLQKPNETQVEYLKAAARHLILANHKWFLEKFHERVTDVISSPKEIIEKFLPNSATWYFATQKGTGHINLFEEYVQVWGEQGKFIGDFEWFYFARSIQVMWNVVAIEKVEEERIGQLKVSEQEKHKNSVEIEETKDNKCLHRPEFFCTLEEAQKIAKGDGVDCYKKCCWSCEKRTICGYACNASKENNSVNTESEVVATSQQDEQIPGQMEVYDYPEIIPESMQSIAVEETQELVFDEAKDENEVDWTDLQLLEKMVEEENKILNDILGCFDENESIARKQKIKVAALATLLCDMDVKEQEEPVKIELPILKNNEQRKKFLENYQIWPVWFEVPQASETYYRLDLLDGSSIVICEYCTYVQWKERYGENPESIYRKEYLLKPGYKYLHDCETNTTALIEHLKNVNKVKL